MGQLTSQGTQWTRELELFVVVDSCDCSCCAPCALAWWYWVTSCWIDDIWASLWQVIKTWYPLSSKAVTQDHAIDFWFNTPITNATGLLLLLKVLMPCCSVAIEFSGVAGSLVIRIVWSFFILLLAISRIEIQFVLCLMLVMWRKIKIPGSRQQIWGRDPAAATTD